MGRALKEGHEAKANAGEAGMMWVVVALLVLIAFQLGRIIALIRYQTGMIKSASDLNLEAHARLHGEAEAANEHLSQMPKMRQPWEP